MLFLQQQSGRHSPVLRYVCGTMGAQLFVFFAEQRAWKAWSVGSEQELCAVCSFENVRQHVGAQPLLLLYSCCCVIVCID